MTGMLSCAQVVMGLTSMAPDTVHDGLWRLERARLVFQYYDYDGDGHLDNSELSSLLGDMLRTSGDNSSAERIAELVASMLPPDGLLTLLEFTHLATLVGQQPCVSCLPWPVQARNDV